MIEVRRDDEIHEEEGGWFEARWHFSFDHWRDSRQMGIGPLRVFNDDRLVPGADWPMHPHADVEGLTLVVEGTFEHADSLGNGGTLLPGGRSANDDRLRRPPLRAEWIQDRADALSAILDPPGHPLAAAEPGTAAVHAQ